MNTYPLNLKEGVVLVQTRVIGPRRAASVQMILDTGASLTLLDPDILIEAGYDPSGTSNNRPITTASGIEYCPLLKIKAAVALGHTIRDLEVCAHSLPQGLPARGLLGLNFLRYFNVHLNFLNGYLDLRDKTKSFNNLDDFLKDLKK